MKPSTHLYYSNKMEWMALLLLEVVKLAIVAVPTIQFMGG